MSKIIKASLIAVAFAFAAGCSSHEGPCNAVTTDNLSGTAQCAPCNKCHKNPCRCHKVRGKLCDEPCRPKCDVCK